MRASLRQLAGFTLLELMIVIAIMAALLGIALPDINSWIVGARVKSAVSDMHSTMLKARSEAIKRNRDIIVVRDPTLPPTPPAWKLGWQLRESTVAGTLLAQQDPMQPNNPGFTINVRRRNGTVWSDYPDDVITFKPTGRIDVSAESIIVVVSATGTASRCVVLAPSGSASVRAANARATVDGTQEDVCN